MLADCIHMYESLIPVPCPRETVCIQKWRLNASLMTLRLRYLVLASSNLTNSRACDFVAQLYGPR